MKICAITKKKCFRWHDEKTTFFCDTCPVAISHENEISQKNEGLNHRVDDKSITPLQGAGHPLDSSMKTDSPFICGGGCLERG